MNAANHALTIGCVLIGLGFLAVIIAIIRAIIRDRRDQQDEDPNE
jgi:hypothetical protein